MKQGVKLWRYKVVSWAPELVHWNTCVKAKVRVPRTTFGALLELRYSCVPKFSDIPKFRNENKSLFLYHQDDNSPSQNPCYREYNGPWNEHENNTPIGCPVSTGIVDTWSIRNWSSQTIQYKSRKIKITYRKRNHPAKRRNWSWGDLVRSPPHFERNIWRELSIFSEQRSCKWTDWEIEERGESTEWNCLFICFENAVRFCSLSIRRALEVDTKTWNTTDRMTE